MTYTAWIDDAGSLEPSIAPRAKSRLRIVGAVLAFSTVGAVSMTVGWMTLASGSHAPDVALVAPAPKLLAPAAKPLTEVASISSSGAIALAPGWIYDPVAQVRPAPQAQAPVADVPVATQPPPVASVPLPIANPLFAGLGLKDEAARAALEESETLTVAPLPPRNPLAGGNAEVASLTPPEAPMSGGPANSGPAAEERLSLPGPGDRYAIYDIKARAVYLPGGKKLEAHSGFGEMMDNVRHVSVRMRGPTPPNVYELTMREKLFHGVEALRMTPVGDGNMYGRNGILAHSYLLGPGGDSNGCVSFKEYDKFLAAYKRGEVSRIIVVAEMPEGPPVANRLLSWLTSL